jgi:formate hydrogenlyase subunit 6/NADH:ubiquinone oxidoreductase subunit I
MSTYFKNISRGLKTTLKGMSLTLKHFWNARRSRKPYAMQDSNYFDLKTGIVTLQYPHQTLPVPDNGRYQLDCEIDDCIVCDKCAKVCPVDCIDIEPIKSAEVISYTSDGSPVRLYAAKFDIDMAKCCFCGLCTTVCPTECLTMTNEYDFSVVDITQMNFGFSNLSAEQADKKRKLYEQYVAEKEELKKSPQSTVHSPQSINKDSATPKPKTAFKPAFKPSTKVVESADNQEIKEEKQEIVAAPKPAFKPSFKPVIKTTQNTESKEVKEEKQEPVAAPKPAFKPSFKPVIKTAQNVESKETKDEKQELVAAPKPAFKPSFKPVVKTAQNTESKEEKQESAVAPKPAFKPTFKPKFTQPTITGNIEIANKSVQSSTIQDTPKAKPVFKPSFKITPKKDK